MMKFPTVFVNHGGGPMPLLGLQPDLVQHMKELRSKILPKEKPKSIVVFSAHWESDPIKISSASTPKMYFDYHGFPPESYEYKYPAPGSPVLAHKIQSLLGNAGLESELDDQRGFDHGVFIPLMIMYPEADIPVVSVSLHSSSAQTNIQIGRALQPLREEGILILGSGYTFHNMDAFFRPSDESHLASVQFNEWLKDTILSSSGDVISKLLEWDNAPGARISHPREEHLLPLFMTAAAAAAGPNNAKPKVVYESSSSSTCSINKKEHKVTGYIFE